MEFSMEGKGSNVDSHNLFLWRIGKTFNDISGWEGKVSIIEIA